MDTFFTKTVAANRDPAANDKVHADAALDAINGGQRLDKTVAKFDGIVFLFHDSRPVH